MFSCEKINEAYMASATEESHVWKPASGSKEGPGSQFPKFLSELSHSAASGHVAVSTNGRSYVHGGHKAKEKRESGHH